MKKFLILLVRALLKRQPQRKMSCCLDFSAVAFNMRGPICILILLANGSASAELVCQRWGAAKTHCPHPGTLKMTGDKKASHLTVDLSSLPKETTIHRASLVHLGGAQPIDPIEIYLADTTGAPKSGKPLVLQPPWFRSFELTESVRQWVKDPATNFGMRLVNFEDFNLRQAFVEILYEGKAKDLPEQVSKLKVLHHDGQTFLVFKELPIFQPPADKLIWVDKFMPNHHQTVVAMEPGKAYGDVPRLPAVRLQELRDLQGLKVRDKPLGDNSQNMPPHVRLRELPEVAYRIYRSRQQITPETLPSAEQIGEVKPLCAYVEGMTIVDSEGEYRNKRERGDSIIPTHRLGENLLALPGEAYYVHSPREEGKFFYAVTALQNGTENVSQISSENSLADPLEEKLGTPKPILQYVMPSIVYRSKVEMLEHHHDYYLAPPLANLPINNPLEISVGVSAQFKSKGPLYIGGLRSTDPSQLQLLIQHDIAYSGCVCYSEGRGTLRSFKETKVDFFSERYMLAMIQWAMSHWETDRDQIQSDLPTHFTIRHPELFAQYGTDPAGVYELNMDQRWNPFSGSLASRLGPAETATTVDGQRAWDVFFIGAYLSKNPAKDIPFMGCLMNQAKDGNHGAEYGWQDDPKGFAALRDARQPYVATWGGGSTSREVRSLIRTIRLGRSIPAFSRCSLDNNPGNGDPDDGDPLGQLNGFLLWQDADLVDEENLWEMTVCLAGDSPDTSCVVDVTPRHCMKFKPKAGQQFKWSNTTLEDARELGSGELAADQWGLVTLPQITVTKQKGRIKVFVK